MSIVMYLKSFVHNVIVHPFMMVLPSGLAGRMHDRNADWAFTVNRSNELELENQISQLMDRSPAEHLKRYLDSTISLEVHAQKIGLTTSDLDRILHNRFCINKGISLKLSNYTNTHPLYWYRLYLVHKLRGTYDT